MARPVRHLDARRIAEIGAGAIARAERELAAEQAVRGLDALDEREVQEIFAEGFERDGWGVVREAPYPTPPEPARALGAAGSVRPGAAGGSGFAPVGRGRGGIARG